MATKGKKVTYPLVSKRISLAQLRQLAQALDLPSAGNSSDLQVIVEGKLREMERDPSGVQLVLEEDVGGGQHTILLEDENGPFLEIVSPGHSRDQTPAQSVVKVPLSESGSVTGDSQQQDSSSEIESVDEQLQLEQRDLQVQLESARREIVILNEKLEQQKLSEQLFGQSLNEAGERIQQLTSENDKLTQQLMCCPEIDALKKEVQQGKERIKQLWTRSCDQAREFDQILWEKEQEIDTISYDPVQLPEGPKSGESCTLGVPVPVCASFLPTVCETPQVVATPQETQRSTHELTHPVCSSHIHPASQLFVKSEKQLWPRSQSHGETNVQPVTSQTRLFTPSISQPVTERRSSFQTSTNPVSLSATHLPVVTHPPVRTTSFQPYDTGRLTTTDPVMTRPLTSGTPLPTQGEARTSLVDPSVLQTMPYVSSFGHPSQRRGKAPPIDPFSAEDKEIRFDDWISTLERAATWNNWSEEEMLMQLAGHLRNKALQEWNLMSLQERSNYQTAISTLRTRLDPGNKTLAALDFRHITQKENESVSDFIMRLERIFQIAFGHDQMSSETLQGAFITPKGITLNSYNPWCVIKAVFS